MSLAIKERGGVEVPLLTTEFGDYRKKTKGKPRLLKEKNPNREQISLSSDRDRAA